MNSARDNVANDVKSQAHMSRQRLELDLKAAVDASVNA
jgi:hypothetical protein